MLWRGGARGSGGAPKQVARRGEAEEGAADRGSKFDCALLEEGAALVAELRGWGWGREVLGVPKVSPVASAATPHLHSHSANQVARASGEQLR